MLYGDYVLGDFVLGDFVLGDFVLDSRASHSMPACFCTAIVESAVVTVVKDFTLSEIMEFFF